MPAQVSRSSKVRSPLALKRNKVKYQPKDITPARARAINEIVTKVSDESERLGFQLKTSIEALKLSDDLFAAWYAKIRNLDDKCVQLYAAGLRKYDGRGFVEIHRAEKKRMPSTRTLNLHLNHLRSVELVGRSRGHLGKYFFRMPPMLTKKPDALMKNLARVTKSIGIDDEVLWSLDFLNKPLAGASPGEQAKELAGRIWLLYQLSGIYLWDSLDRMRLQTDGAKAERSFYHDSRANDFKVDDIASAFVKRHPAIAEQALGIFHDQVMKTVKIMKWDEPLSKQLKTAL
jgi:hypothetical protein